MMKLKTAVGCGGALADGLDDAGSFHADRAGIRRKGSNLSGTGRA